MSHIVIATQDDILRNQVVEPLADTGHAVNATTDWDGLVRGLADSGCTMVLVDAALPELQPELLLKITASLTHKPLVRVMGGAAPPLTRVSTRQDLLLGQVRARTPASLNPQEQRILRHMGLGKKPFRKLARMATHPLPVRIQGERGTNKESIARALHALNGDTGPFVKHRGRSIPTLSGREGTLYLKDVDEWEEADLEQLIRSLEETRWRIIGGSRNPPSGDDAVLSWTHLLLPPLRERQKDIRLLTRLYLEQYRRTLGMPKRRLDESVWRMLHSYDWPGNTKELEHLVVRVLTSTNRPEIRRRDLPRAVRNLIQKDPHAEIRDLAHGFEQVVEARLGPIVGEYQIDSELGLHRLAVNATERALFRLALSRTGGNQKAAANLLGVARNTLRTKITQLGIEGEET